MKRTVRISDLSGNAIPDGELVQLKIPGYPEPTQATTLDLSRAELETLLGGATGKIERRRGRKPAA